jgi:hypothetical protein
MLPVSLYCTFLIAPSVYYRPVSCVAYVASFSVLSIFDCPIGLFSKYTKIVRNEFTENYVEIFFLQEFNNYNTFFLYVAVR